MTTIFDDGDTGAVIRTKLNETIVRANEALPKADPVFAPTFSSLQQLGLQDSDFAGMNDQAVAALFAKKLKENSQNNAVVRFAITAEKRQVPNIGKTMPKDVEDDTQLTFIATISGTSMILELHDIYWNRHWFKATVENNPDAVIPWVEVNPTIFRKGLPSIGLNDGSFANKTVNESAGVFYTALKALTVSNSRPPSVVFASYDLVSTIPNLKTFLPSGIADSSTVILDMFLNKDIMIIKLSDIDGNKVWELLYHNGVTTNASWIEFGGGSSGGGFTQSQADARYPLKADVFTKSQMQNNYYNHAQSDARYAKLNGATFTSDIIIRGESASETINVKENLKVGVDIQGTTTDVSITPVAIDGTLITAGALTYDLATGKWSIGGSEIQVATP